MKLLNIFALACAFCVSVAAFAAQDDALICFSTVGKDYYSDGVEVKDGENYALVWVKEGAEFAGIRTDGTLVDAENSVLLTVLPRAHNGRCLETLVEMPLAYYNTLTATGSLKLYLLDTRKADGETVAKSDELDGGVRAVSEVAALEIEGGSIKDAQGKEGVAAGAAVVLKPVIKSVEVKDGKFVIKVENTNPVFNYNVGSGASPKAIAGGAAEAKAGNTRSVIAFEVPMQPGENAKFFNVTGEIK